MIYCPRCDKPIAPDHRCLSRRHFLGLFAGAAAAVIAPPKLVYDKARRTIVPVTVTFSEQLYRLPIQLYRGGAFHAYDPTGGDLR